jgi:hypothetical protein
MSRRVVIDIETIGEEFEGLDELSKEYILRYAETEKEIESAKQGLGLSPLTGEVVAIGMLDPDTDKGVVYFQSPEVLQEPLKEDGFELIPDTEAGILRRFWERVKDYDQIITFNGRGFDAPFIILRSAILRIKPTKDLMPSRYSGTSHIDLLDQLTFYGSVRRRFSLHMWCRAFGIKSPKEEGVSGLEVARLFKEKRYLEIARYCIGDLYATKELFEYWDKYVRYASGG